jgi:hypothetical protein
MADTATLSSLKSSIRSAELAPDERAAIAREAAAALPDEQKKELAQALLFGLKPDGGTLKILYLMVIGALIVILLAAAGMLTGVLVPRHPGATMDRVLGIFTTVLSFIIGLFVPSPADRR